MNILHARWFLPVIILVTAGCNSDIFIDEDRHPVMSDVELEPGGVSEVCYQGEDLHEISLLLPAYGQMDDTGNEGGTPWDEDNHYVGYPTYGREDFDYVCRFCYDSGRCDTVVMRYGGWLAVFSQDRQLCRSLTVENSFMKLDLEFKSGRRIEIVNCYNLTDSVFKCSLNFNYRYKEDVVNVTAESTMLTEAGKYNVAGIEYEKLPYAREFHSRDTVQFEAFNPGPEMLRTEFPIAPHCKAYIDFRVNPEMAPLFGAAQPELKVAIPTFGHIEQGEGLIYGEIGFYGEAVPFSWQTVIVPGLDSALSPVFREIGYSFDHVYGFKLSPDVGVRAYLYVDRITNRVRARLKARNVESGNEFFIPVDVIVDQPYFYGLDYERVEIED